MTVRTARRIFWILWWPMMLGAVAALIHPSKWINGITMIIGLAFFIYGAWLDHKIN